MVISNGLIIRRHRVRIPNHAPNMNLDELNHRSKKLMEHIDKQIMMCDNEKDLLILSFSMLNRSRSILDKFLGPEKRKTFFKEHTD